MNKLVKTAHGYKVEPALMNKAQQDLDALTKTDEVKKLTIWMLHHMPQETEDPNLKADNRVVGLVDAAIKQKMLVEELSQQLQATAVIKTTSKSASIEYDNELFLKYDAELQKFRLMKAEIVDSEWGQELEQLVDDVVESDEFEALEEDWEAQCETDGHKKTLAAFEGYIQTAIESADWEDFPEGFEESATIDQAIRMYDLFHDVATGDLGEIKDYMFEDDYD